MAASLIITGFMGSGKTAVGREVAERLSRPFIDTDAEIVRRAGKSVPEIFASGGEETFRRLETQAVLEVLDGSGAAGAVVALGGGAVTNEPVRKRLEGEPLVVLLDVDAGTAFRRARGGGRPLARDRVSFSRLLSERQKIYGKVAKMRVNTKGKSIAEVAAELTDIIAGKEKEAGA